MKGINIPESGVFIRKRRRLQPKGPVDEMMTLEM